MLTVDEEMEGKYFTACLSHWIKMSETRNEVGCQIIKFEPDCNNDIMNLTNILLTKGEFVQPWGNLGIRVGFVP